MSTAATLTSKGQTTIPKEIREGLGLKPGDRITFTLLPDGAVILRVKKRSVRDLYRTLRSKKRVTVADMRSWK
jgi:AbrB family looped-hinge helix DNA binding protein